MRHIKVLGITGSVGSGKSTVLAYLQEKYHAPVLQLDEQAHRLMEPGGICCAPIAEAFGNGVLCRDGGVDRSALYAQTFGNRERVLALNAIVHPKVKEAVRNWVGRHRQEGCAPFLVLEAALLLEDHYEQICDEIWYIHVEDSVRVRRLADSRGYTEEKTRRILQNQKSEQEFRAACGFVVDNSSDDMENTYEQIDKGLREHGFV